MNFGNVSFRLLVSVTLLAGCSSELTENHDLYLKYERYENRVGFCLNEARESDYLFLRSDWLRSLNEEVQMQVIIYLSSLTMVNCSIKEKEDFVMALANEMEDVKKIITKSLHLDIPIKPKPVGIDEKQLDVLASQITSPFSAFTAFDALRNSQE